MKFIKLWDTWINLSQIKFIRVTRGGVNIHFSAENITDKISISEDEGKILMEALNNFSVNFDASFLARGQ